MIGLTMKDVAVGDVAEVTYTVTAETIREFVTASGDDNPIHSDAAFAADTRFGRVIAPGMLTGSFVSSVIGTRLPGPGTIYLSQSFRFMRPVYIGDRVTARVEVAERVAERNRLRLGTTCVNQDGELLLEGEAWVLPSPTRIEYAAPSSRPPLDGGGRPPAGGAGGRDDVDLDVERPHAGDAGAPAGASGSRSRRWRREISGHGARPRPTLSPGAVV